MELLEELREDFLTCHICFEEYQEPRQLPCLHTFCRQCLSRYIVGRVLETGAPWFPCPLCRQAVQPHNAGEVLTWADSFPVNFLLSQLSAKLQQRTSDLLQNVHDVTSDTTPRVKCLDHPESCLVAYCGRKRSAVCDECCTQGHWDCVSSHIRERDSRPAAQTRATDCRHHLANVQMKVDSLQESVLSREVDLASQSDTLHQRMEATLTDLKLQLDRYLAEQRQGLATKLDTFIGRERRRQTAIKEQAEEVRQMLGQISLRLEAVGGGLSVQDLVELNRIQEDLKRQDHALDRLRKDNVARDLHFLPGDRLDQALRGLTVATLTADFTSQASGGARPRVQRYVSDPNHYAAEQAVSPRRGHDSVWEQQDPPRSARVRTLSPAGAASSALSSSPANAAGPSVGEHDSQRDRENRRRSEGSSVQPSRKATTVPDFGAVLIEESRRSRSNPRRARPQSEGAALLRRRGTPKETLIDDSSHTVRSPERCARAVDQAAPVVHARANSESQRTERTVSPNVAMECLISSEDDDPFSVSEVRTASPSTLGGAGATVSDFALMTGAERDAAESELDGQSSRRILCIGRFTSMHESDVKNQPGLVGICAVGRDRVAVSDRWNKAVKLLDISGRIMDVLILSEGAEPWDLALRRPGLLAVTYPKEQKIRMVDVGDGGSRLFYRSHFMTRDGYASLATCNSTSLLASVCPPFGQPKMHVIDYLGAVLVSIDCSSVAYPRCVDMCGPEQMCVSDWTHHNIKVFSVNTSTLKLTYAGVEDDTPLKAPMGVAWDGRSHLFVVDGKTSRLHAVHVQSGQCTAIFRLPQSTGEEIKLICFVEASADLCHSEQALVVTTTTGAIQVYDLCVYD